MKNLSLTFCLVIAALLASVGSGFALPTCLDSPSSDPRFTGKNWNDCKGSLTFPNGDKYVGEFKDGEINGQGTYTFASGSKYVGEFKNNNQHGQGTYTFANGNKYVGEFKNNKRNGQGTFTWASGDKYVGESKNSYFNGQGTYTYPNGDKYLGEWSDNKKDGQGTYTFGPKSEWAGDKYVGEYKDGKKNGQGTYTFANGTVKEGIWKDGDFQYAKKLTPPVPVAKTPTQDDEIISASSGSGFAVSSDGYVITNHHVIEGCQKVVVHTKGKELPVTVVTYDPQNDLALLKGDFRPKTVFPLSNNRPELLQDIYVAGFPFGDKFSTSVKVTKGIISSLTGLGNNFSNIQIDAALQSGNSGGPILDDFGNVIGVAVSKLDAKYMFEEFGIIPENTNFGIKSSVVRSVLDSNEVDSPPANQSAISKSKLGKMISSGTYYISCWMTMAQIEKMKTKKVFFSNLD
ncbi:trypsin-like peptidase domain-containing protein [Paracoccaceae bacterium]|nr:trypsin-like peptidase domain-containing protein [Paracoccaceae bacterium]